MMRLRTVAGLTMLSLASASQSWAQNPARPPAGTARDALFAQPYVDVDEWRDAPVRHHYVHGGFKGTETRFSFYFPDKARYRGRFFQHITPVPDSENLAQQAPRGEEDWIGFAIASGGYFVETNGGGKDMTGRPGVPIDFTIAAYRANAAAADYSRVVAQRILGGGRPHGYAFGGSGGGFRTVGSIEHTDGGWDGVVPYVLGSPMAPPNMFTIRMRAMRVLWDKFPAILDAVEPGGSGDPYAGLTAEQASVLREATAMGFPTPSWFGYRTMGIHGFAALYGGMLLVDPGYFKDFWSRPGYLGHDHPEQLAGARIQHAATIVGPVTAAEAARLKGNPGHLAGTPRVTVDNAFQGRDTGDQRIVGFRLSSPPPAIQFLGGDLFVDAGAAKGRRLTIASVEGDVVLLGDNPPDAANGVARGDAVRLDNSSFLASQTYHWHQVPPLDAGYPEWDQFRRADGTPLYPQRPLLIGPLFTAATTGAAMGTPPMTGVFKGKMILLESLWDREAMPWQGDWYRQRVAAHLGGATDGQFRIWMTDHALHGDETRQEDPTRTVSYLGVLQQALRDVAAWVERGVAPPASTVYRVADGQVIVPPGAAARRGVQPVAVVTADGGARATAHPGQRVSFRASVTIPPGTGRLIAAEWDYDGSGRFADHATLPPLRRGAMSIVGSHAFRARGTFFPALRVVSQRDGDATTPYARIQNLGRVRVVVD